MILDALLRLANKQNFTQADEVTENTIPLGSVVRHIGTGEPLSMIFCITTAATGSGGSQTDATSFRAITDTVASLASPTVLAEVPRDNADLVAGALVEVPLPKGLPDEGFLGGQVVLGAGDTLSASVFVVPRSFVPALRAYPDAVEIL